MRYLKVAAIAVFALALAGPVVIAQRLTGPDGAFLSTADYMVSGQWLFNRSSNPVCFEGATVDANKTCVTATDPTASRVLTLPDATDTVVGRATTDTLTNKTLTAPVIATVTNTGSLTLPTATGGVPVLLDCGATGTGNQTCSPVTATAATKVYAGNSVLSASAAVITFSPAFAATTSYQCLANDITTRANPVQMISTSASTATITNTTGTGDTINWICAGY